MFNYLFTYKESLFITVFDDVSRGVLREKNGEIREDLSLLDGEVGKKSVKLEAAKLSIPRTTRPFMILERKELVVQEGPPLFAFDYSSDDSIRTGTRSGCWRPWLCIRSSVGSGHHPATRSFLRPIAYEESVDKYDCQIPPQSMLDIYGEKYKVLVV